MVASYNADHPDAPLVILDEAMTTEPYAFAFAMGNDALVDEINKILEGLLADGTIAAIFEKYDAPYTAP
jgi:ABC-type amino acid transport substrate-binding protein